MYSLKGTIQEIRIIEDAVRKTEQYTEGLFTEGHKHPIQGEESTRAFKKQYELYIDAPLHKRTDIKGALKWYDSRVAIFKFWYDYREQEASMEVSEEGLLLSIETFKEIKKVFKGYPPFKMAEEKVVDGISEATDIRR